MVFHIPASKLFGIDPRVEGSSAVSGGQGGNGGRGLSGGQAQVHLDASLPCRYILTVIAATLSVFNFVNRGTPNCVLNSTLFGQTQSLAAGQFG
jgi:hypothetical protein